MSACPTPPACPDLFRSGPHPTRDLGSLTSKVNTLYPPVQPRRVVLQLTQEEDQAVTNLLKLHHQEPLQSANALIAPQMDLNRVLWHPEPMDSTLAEEGCEPHVQLSREGILWDRLQQRCWSYVELEAANTLLGGFSSTEKDHRRSRSHNKSATLPDPLPYQSQGSGEPSWGFVDERTADLATSLPPRLPSDLKAESRSGGDSSEVQERTLSDSEGDAVLVLLSLGDMGVVVS